MQSFDRVKKRLVGEPVDRPPNFDIMMTFAAHFIGQPLSKYYADYRVLCDANWAVQEAFGLDVVQAISDPYREAADLGCEVSFPPDDLPLCTRSLLSCSLDLDRLGPPERPFGRRMTDRLEAVRALNERAARQVPVLGWVEGALAEAADLRGVTDLLADLIERPEWVCELLERCAAVEIVFAQAQVAAGADIVGLGDAIASQISPRMYRRFALPYEQRIFAAVHQMGALGRLHICGNTSHILQDMAQSGADILDLDWMVDFGRAAQTLADGPALCGNFDPVAVMLQGSPQSVYRAVQDCARQGGLRSFSAAGCEIPDQTPIANLDAQKRALMDF
jgi:MtaA/CmuA family methyltransferase